MPSGGGISHRVFNAYWNNIVSGCPVVRFYQARPMLWRFAISARGSYWSLSPSPSRKYVFQGVPRGMTQLSLLLGGIASQSLEHLTRGTTSPRQCKTGYCESGLDSSRLLAKRRYRQTTHHMRTYEGYHPKLRVEREHRPLACSLIHGNHILVESCKTRSLY